MYTFFATCVNHKLPMYVFLVPDEIAWDIDALNINWSGLTTYAYPPKAGYPPDCPWISYFWFLVQLSTEIPLLLPASKCYSNSHTIRCFTTPSICEPTHLVSRSRLLCFDFHCGLTVQRRQVFVSSTSLEVLSGSYLRGSQSLLYISFKKGHTSDIRPATLSSWLEQTILLCYKQAD